MRFEPGPHLRTMLGRALHGRHWGDGRADSWVSGCWSTVVRGLSRLGDMAGFEDVERLVAGLPETAEITRHGNRTWSVGGKAYAWERPERSPV